MHTELEQERALARLLQGLPDGGASPYDFSEFQRRAHAAPARSARLAGARALAAAIVIAVALLAASIRFGAGPRPAHDRSDQFPAFTGLTGQPLSIGLLASAVIW